MGPEARAFDLSVAGGPHVRHYVHHRAGVDDVIGGRVYQEVNAQRYVHAGV